jgi:hypothetical protein
MRAVTGTSTLPEGGNAFFRLIKEEPAIEP